MNDENGTNAVPVAWVKPHPLTRDGQAYVQRHLDSLGSLHARAIFCLAMGTARRAFFGQREIGAPQLRNLVVHLYGERRAARFD